MKAKPIEAANMPTFGKVPRWGSRLKAFVKENEGRWAPLYTQISTLPYEDHFLDLDPEVKDPLGYLGGYLLRGAGGTVLATGEPEVFRRIPGDTVPAISAEGVLLNVYS
jgi:hypothetical protein